MAETSPLGLAGMRSLYDRNKYNSNQGPIVGQSLPNEEGFYHRGLEADKASAFETVQEEKMDQMVHLLNNDLETSLTNPITGLSPTYKKAPNESPFQDLEGIDIVESSPGANLDSNFTFGTSDPTQGLGYAEGGGPAGGFFS
jgi:hypothetical protein